MSRKQKAANRRNAQLSTGPRTIAGRKKVSLNAVRHGLRGKTVLIPGEDPAEYEGFCRELIDGNAPANAEQRDLAQTIADSYWRLDRVPKIENALYAEGGLFERAEDFLLLSLYEQRISSTLHKNRARLRQLQTGLNHFQ